VSFNQQPFEIIAYPFNVYLAPLGTAFPDISDAENTFDAAWFLLGSSGNKNYDEDGIKVTHDQTIEEFRPVGLSAARKAFRTEESLMIEFNLVDVSAAQYAKVLNDATVTDTPAGAGVGGNLNFELLQDLAVRHYAMVLRGDWSAEGDGFNTQWDIAKCYQNANPEPEYKKGEPARLACEFRVLWDEGTGTFGRFRSQDAAAS
jgi:hypothetical protein